MSTITVIPSAVPSAPVRFRAVSGAKQSEGATVGEAIDALTAEIGAPAETTLVVVQPMVADEFFPAVRRERLAELMDRWRAARAAGAALPAAEQAELEDLSRAEVEASGRRAAALLARVRA